MLRGIAVPRVVAFLRSALRHSEPPRVVKRAGDHAKGLLFTWAAPAAFLVLTLVSSSGIASMSITPTVSTNGSYVVSWTETSGSGTDARLYQAINGTWATTYTDVTHTNSKAYSGMAPATYSYKIKLYMYEKEIGTWVIIGQSGPVSVCVATAETCNGKDDDCDGQVDEGIAPKACSTGKVGICAAGTTACVNASTVCQQTYQPTTETCNAKDDDCDGQTDEGISPTSCNTGIPGICAPGSTVCVGGTTVCSQTTQQRAETCNLLDDDCDGQFDEGIAAAACVTGLPGVCSAGTTACVSGSTICEQSTQASGDELGSFERCNRLDDDCDGHVDEECTGLDPTFDGDGFVVRAFSSAHDVINDVVVQSDGKIVAAGYASGADPDFIVSRFNPDGSIDTAFGTGGVFKPTGLPVGTDSALAVELQTDGKIVAVGNVTTSTAGIAMLVARLNQTGSLDTTFASGGMRSISVNGSIDQARAVRVLPDGKILVGGMSLNPTTFAYDSVLVRLTPAGANDEAFGTNGIAINAVSAGDDGVESLALAPDGTITASGFADADGTRLPMVARFTDGGAFDTAFGSGGRVLAQTPSGGNAEAVSVVLDSTSRPIIAARFADSPTYAALGRFAVDGSLDATFGGAGWATADLTDDDDVISDVLAESGGEAVAVGSAGKAILVARYAPNGTLDSSFATDGWALISLGAGYSAATSVAKQADGKYIIGGYYFDGVRYTSALVRVMPY